jgi:ribonuclease HI
VDYVAYCDGASRKDGRGGWGAYIEAGARTISLYGGEHDTTNNRMELMACIETLWYLPARSSIELVCDSQYVVKGATEYAETWVRAGWRTSSNKAVANQDLWEELLLAVRRHRLVTWRWVKGHNGNEGNEHADRLAGMGVPKE